MMLDQLPVLIVAVPLLASLIVAIVGWFNPRWSQPITVASLLFSLWAAANTLGEVLVQGNRISYRLGSWKPPFGIEYGVDHLNGMVLVVVALVATLTAVYARNGVKKELGDKETHFYILFLLFVTGLLGMTITGDAFNVYVLLEVASLSGYALIAMGKGRAHIATFNYIIMGSMGACFYLLGVGYLLIKTGSLNMVDIQGILLTLTQSKAVLTAFIFIIVGLWVKMALFPLHGWLPNAYTHCPTATACIMAPLMTKVSVYLMLRMMFGVFSADYVFNYLNWQPYIMLLAVIAIIAGSIYALMQTNMKKMLTYIIVAEIGYMVGGAWCGSKAGLQGATYHILADALMTLCLFMVVGCIMYTQKTNTVSIHNLQGIFKKMPITMIAFIIGAFSMIGIPPTGGFFSKWYLISGAYQSGDWLFIVALLVSSLVNAILFFRIIEIGFFGDIDKNESHDHHHDNVKVQEAPLSMTVPLLIVASLLIIVGVFTGKIMSHIIDFTIPAGLN